MSLGELPYRRQRYVPDLDIEAPPAEEVFRAAFRKTRAVTLADLLADLDDLGLWVQAHARVALAQNAPGRCGPP